MQEMLYAFYILNSLQGLHILLAFGIGKSFWGIFKCKKTTESTTRDVNVGAASVGSMSQSGI